MKEEGSQHQLDLEAVAASLLFLTPAKQALPAPGPLHLLFPLFRMPFSPRLFLILQPSFETAPCYLSFKHIEVSGILLFIFPSPTSPTTETDLDEQQGLCLIHRTWHIIDA